MLREPETVGRPARFYCWGIALADCVLTFSANGNPLVHANSVERARLLLGRIRELEVIWLDAPSEHLPLGHRLLPGVLDS